MTISTLPIQMTQSMGTWFNRQNTLASLMSSNVVTADSNTLTGSVTQGNVGITGYVYISNLFATNLSGGVNISTPTDLKIISNTQFNYGTNTLLYFTANSISSNLIVNTAIMTIANTTLITGDIHFSNSINVNNFVSANTANIGGAIVTNQGNQTTTSKFGNNNMGTDVVYIYSNSSIGLTSTTNTGIAIKGIGYTGNGVMGVSNSGSGVIGVANLTGSGLIGISNSGYGAQITSNSGSPIIVGNTITTFFQTYANGSSYVANSLLLTGLYSANLNSNGIYFGNSTVNTSINSSSIAISSATANLNINVLSFSIGNSLSHTTINSSSVISGNSVISSLGSNLAITNTVFVTANAMMIANSITIGSASVNSVVNATNYTGTSANSTLFNNHPEAYYANVTNPVISTTIGIGAAIASVANGVNANNSYITIGNSAVFSTVNSTIFSQTANNANNLNGHPEAYYANVTNPVISTNITVGSISNNVIANTTYITIGNSSVFSTVNSTVFSATAANASLLNSQPYTYYANVTSPVFSTSVNVGTTSITTSNISIGITGTTANSVTSNSSYISIGNSSVNSFINSTFYSSNSNNALNLGGVIATGYQGTANLATAVALITSNSSNYIGTLPAASVANNSTPSISTSLTVGGTVINTTSISVTGNLISSQLNISGNAVISGNLSVSGQIIYVGTATASGSYIPAVNTVYSIGNSTMWWANTYSNNFICNTHYFTGGGTVNNTIYTGTSANTTLFNNQPASYYANATQYNGNVSPQLLTVSGNGSIGGNLTVSGLLFTVGNTNIGGNIIPTANISFNVGNSTLWFNNIYGLNHSANIVNFVGGGTVNNTIYTGTSANSTLFNNQPSSYYANVSLYTGNVTTLAANVTTLNVFANTYANGISSTIGSYYGQFIAISGTTGVVFRNDGTNFIIASNTTNPYSVTMSNYRPLSFNLTTGAVSIDTGTSVGGTTFGGNVTTLGNLVVGNITLNNANGLTVSSNNLAAIVATSNSGAGIVVSSNSGIGITVTTNTGYGLNVTSSYIPINATANAYQAISGTSNSGYGGAFTSNTNIGIYGQSTSLTGVLGQSNNNYGVIARSTYGNPFWAGNTNNAYIYVDSSGNFNALYNANVSGSLNVGGSAVLTTSTYNTYTPTLTGTGASGTWGINITGNAGTATNSTQLNGQISSYYANSTQFTGVFNGSTVTASGASVLKGLTTANGVVSTLGSAYGQFTAITASHGVIFRNDDTNFLILSANSTSALSSWNDFRPFQFNLNTGAVQIDTGVTPSGTTIGGSLTINGATNLAGGFSGVHSTTNIGNSSPQSLISLTSNNAWSALPIGYVGYMNTTSSYLPNSVYGYFNKVGIRDSNNGWGGLYINYDLTQMYWGGTTIGSNSPTWKNIIDSGNYNTYTPTLTGTGASGTWGINITGNAGTATTATTATNSTQLDGVGASSYALLSGPTFSGTVSVPTLSVSGNETIGGTLGVTGTSTLAAVTTTGLTVNGNETINGNLSTTGFVQGPLMNVNAITTGYTIVNSDLGKVILVNNGASNITINVPTLTQYGRLMITRNGTGTVTLSGSGATLYSRTGGFSIMNQFGSVSVFFTSAGTAIVDGNI